MPESRDRLSRPEEVSMIFVRRWRTIRGLDIFSDESAGSPGGTPLRLQGHVGAAEATTGRGGGVLGRGSLVTPRTIGHGRENVRPGSSSRSRGSGSILPSWYPRTPLRDITTVVRAIERRRARLREMESPQLGTPTPEDQIAHDPSYEPTLNAQLEHIDFQKSMTPAAGKKSCCPPSVAKILLNITQREEGENSDCLTLEKKLLNSIDTVGKVVMKELEKMKKTPSAKRALREKKIRTLMSMR